eukprot:457279-Alexandrium_andersonii.AAC.1
MRETRSQGARSRLRLLARPSSKRPANRPCGGARRTAQRYAVYPSPSLPGFLRAWARERGAKAKAPWRWGDARGQ